MKPVIENFVVRLIPECENDTPTTYDYCVAAALAMEGDGAHEFDAYIRADDVNECIGFEAGGRILKVSIRCVDDEHPKLHIAHAKKV